MTSIKNLFLLIFSTLFLVVPFQNLEASEALNREQRQEKERNRKKYGFGASYGMSYDALETVEDKTIGHQLGLNARYFLGNNWLLNSSVAFFHNSFDLKVYRANPDDNYHQVSDTNLGLTHVKRNLNKYIARIADRISILLPTSERSRIDQRRFALTFSNSVASGSWKKFRLIQSFSASYASHRLKFSLFNNDSLNRDLALTESLALTYQAFPWLGLSFNAYFRVFRFLDKSWDNTFGNSVTVFTSVGRAGIFLSYINRSVSELDGYRIDYFNSFERVIQAGVTYDF